jgi:hypothetical protein
MEVGNHDLHDLHDPNRYFWWGDEDGHHFQEASPSSAMVKAGLDLAEGAPSWIKEHTHKDGARRWATILLIGMIIPKHLG